MSWKFCKVLSLFLLPILVPGTLLHVVPLTPNQALVSVHGKDHKLSF